LPVLSLRGAPPKAGRRSNLVVNAFNNEIATPRLDVGARNDNQGQGLFIYIII